MTPLSLFVTRALPAPLRIPALALLYAAIVAGVMIATRRSELTQIIYVDVRGG